jgi:hypothetical protein
MKLGEIARVARGIVTGNRKLYIMTREEAKERDVEQFVKPVLGGSTAFPKTGKPVVRDSPDRHVLLVTSARDVNEFPALRAYLGDVAPKVASVRIAPIAATYVGVPRFVANPDGLVITNSLYTVTPRKKMTAKEIVALVEQLNAAMSKLPRALFGGRYTPRTLEAIEI